MKNTFDTIVAGITKDNVAGKDRQKILKSYVKENYDYNRFDKDDSEYWSTADIKEFEWEVYQYGLFEEGTIDLIPEPNNPYDKNAIKVVHKVMGDLGYIPKKDNVNLANFIELNSGNINLSFDLEGGKYKYYDGEKIITGSKPYGLRIYVNPIVRIEENKDYELKSLNYNTINSGADVFSNQEDFIIEKPKKVKNTKEEKSNNKYLVACCFGLLVALLCLVTDSYFGFILMMILSILGLRIYFKESKKDKKWKKLYLFLLWLLPCHHVTKTKMKYQPLPKNLWPV